MKKIIIFFTIILSLLIPNLSTVHADPPTSCDSNTRGSCSNLGKYLRECVAGTNNCTYKVWQCQDTGGGVRCMMVVGTGTETSCSIAQTDPDLASCSAPSQGGVNQPTSVDKVFGQIQPPKFIHDLGFGAAGIGKFINTLLGLFYTVCALVLLLMLLLAGYTWITSQGDKEKLAKARATIINAIIGMIIVAIAYLITNTLILPLLGFNKLSQ